MKAVVMEVKDGYAAVLTDDGKFVKVKDQGYEPGMKLSLEETEKKTVSFAERKKRILRQARTFGAVAAAAVCLIAGVNLYNTPYAVISLDVNPSIEITVNRFGRVLDVEAVNEDGAELAETMLQAGVRNQSYDKAVDTALGWIDEGAYEAEDGKVYVVLSASAGDEKYSEKVAEELEERAASHEKISAEVVRATEEEKNEAEKLGTTAGKIHLVNELEAKEPEIEKKEWIDRPVRDIVSEIRKEEPDSQKAEKPDSEVKETEKQEETPEKETPEEKPEKSETDEPEKMEKPVSGEGAGEKEAPEKPEDRNSEVKETGEQDGQTLEQPEKETSGVMEKPAEDGKTEKAVPEGAPEPPEAKTETERSGEETSETAAPPEKEHAPAEREDAPPEKP